MTDESKMNQEQVRKEHLKELNVPAHWGYLFGVLGGGFVLMLAVMALLGGGG